jgi:hypothetical protein
VRKKWWARGKWQDVGANQFWKRKGNTNDRMGVFENKNRILMFWTSMLIS